MPFIPVGGPDLVSQILANSVNLEGFDIIEMTDPQGVTGELFYRLIGSAFEPYKDLATYADIEADNTAIGLVNNSANAQILLTGKQVQGFVIDEPTVNAYTGNDGFILLSITNTISTPEASTLQYRINDGGWQTALSLNANTVDTTYVVIPDLDNNTTYKVDIRHSLFGTQSQVKTLTLTTTPSVENWNAFFTNAPDRDYFYTDSYTNGNTYGLSGKTVMEMMFGSEAVVGAIAEDNQTLGLVEANQNNLNLLVTQPNGMLGLTESTNGMTYAAGSSAFRTTIETTATARDAVTASSVAMPIVAANQDFLNVIEASINFRNSVVASSVARQAFGNSQLAIDTVVSSTGFMTDIVASQDFMNLIVVNQNFLDAIEASGTALTALGTTAIARDTYTATPLAMQTVAASQNYLDTIEGNADFRASVIASQTALDAFVASQTALDTVAASANFSAGFAASETAMLTVANTPLAFETFIASPTAMTAVDNVDLATRILILEQTATQNYANFTNIADFIDDQTAMTEIASSQNAMRALIAGEIAEAELVLEPIALNEVFANLQSTLIVANNPTAVEEVANSTTAMNLVDANDELLRIFLLELTDKDYTTYADVNAVLADDTAVQSIATTAEPLLIGLNSSVALPGLVGNELVLQEITSSQSLMESFAADEALMADITSNTTAISYFLKSEFVNVLYDSDIATTKIWQYVEPRTPEFPNSAEVTIDAGVYTRTQILSLIEDTKSGTGYALSYYAPSSSNMSGTRFATSFDLDLTNVNTISFQYNTREPFTTNNTIGGFGFRINGTWVNSMSYNEVNYVTKSANVSGYTGINTIQIYIEVLSGRYKNIDELKLS